jgi:dTDP-4-dehydrorhamnose reductase
VSTARWPIDKGATRVLVTGGAGRLGRALVRRAPARTSGEAEGLAHERTEACPLDLVAFDRATLDVTNQDVIARALDTHEPDVVINAAAYTAVDRAELDREAAFSVNASGAALLARACQARPVRLVHVSTDHVFGGREERPYREGDATGPRSVYGASKLAGEEAVRGAGGTVVRTSWLFGEGSTGFVPSIAARLRAGERLRVVDDQHGCPTWVDDLADALLALARMPSTPDLLHYCGEGATTWHGFAVAIAETIGVDPSRVTAIRTEEWSAVAPRPAYAVLDTERARALGIRPLRWRPQLRNIFRV